MCGIDILLAKEGKEGGGGGARIFVCHFAMASERLPDVVTSVEKIGRGALDESGS